MTRVLGVDLALTHGALVLLDDGELARWWTYSDRVSVCIFPADRATHTRVQLHDDVASRGVRRLLALRGLLSRVLDEAAPHVVVTEDYAHGSGQGAHQIGELGGVWRTLLWEHPSHVLQRFWSPKSVKLFGAGNGNADKLAVRTAVNETLRRRAGASPFLDYNKDSGGDLCDAYTLASMGWTELRLKWGHLTAQSLQDHERRALFPKKGPGVIDLQWLRREDEDVQTDHTE